MPLTNVIGEPIELAVTGLSEPVGERSDPISSISLPGSPEEFEKMKTFMASSEPSPLPSSRITSVNE